MVVKKTGSSSGSSGSDIKADIKAEVKRKVGKKRARKAGGAERTRAAATDTIMVRKRDGRLEELSADKIGAGIVGAAEDAGADVNGRFDELIKAIVADIEGAAADEAGVEARVIDAADITTIVKRNLMDFQYYSVAEAYILYSDKRRKARLRPDSQLISDFIVLTRYARYRPDLGRRETFEEVVDRVEGMHLRRFPDIADDIKWAFDFVRRKEVLPSMRSMQYGGKAMEANNAKGFNCSFSVCNRPRFFAEAFWLLLSGVGVGFSVQFHHVDQLPPLKFIDESNVVHHIIEDSIEGWADAADVLINSYMKTGKYVEFSYHKIRPQGTPLRTSGGMAPGHLPLRRALENVRRLLDGAQGRQLKPIECYDIVCMLADAVYSGGIREAACLCLFSIDDGEMMLAKTGNWHDTHPWRSRCNNSVALIRGEVKRRQFNRIFKATKQWGEPGILFIDDEDYGTNPCGEIGLNPKLVITPEVKVELEKWAEQSGRKLPKLKIGQVWWGWQLCNLSEVNVSTVESVDDLMQRVRAASIIGTIQAAYTDMPYLGWVSEAICRREALLGVSMTGMMDRPDITLDPQVQLEAAQLAVEVNAEMAAKIGINSAARVTCIKPSGTASLVVGSASGIHPHHARRYFRRIRVNPNDPVYQYFKEHNPHMCVSISPVKDLIVIPVQAPNGALVRREMSAIDLLNHVLTTQSNWVAAGTAKPNSSVGLTHNVSNTITVKPDEWDEVAKFIWNHRNKLGGITLLSDIGDKEYANAPREEVTTEADELKWYSLIENYKPVDWSQFKESEDRTTLRGEVACGGGACML